jgi:AraC family transcriptional regulator of adaptative response/methylated-DNA-[protein]-cysteine methyltransferase
MPNLEALAAAVGMSRFHFHRVFKTLTGVTPKAYAAAHRAQRVRDELSRTDTVTAAIYGAGFHSNGRFYATSSEVLGMTPTNFRSGGHGASMRFAVGECSLGSILVAATDKGVCAILLGDDPDVLVRDLQDRFPKAQLLGGDETSSGGQGSRLRRGASTGARSATRRAGHSFSAACLASLACDPVWHHGELHGNR